MPLPPTYKFRSIPTLNGLYTKFGSDPKPTLAQQTYEKVCAIETILNSLLADSTTPVSSPPVSERPLYLATAGPEMPLSVIRLEDASDYLPCFDEADLLYGIPGLPILMSYCPEQVMDIGEESYLVGPMVFFRIDHIGNTVSLQVDRKSVV